MVTHYHGDIEVTWEDKEWKAFQAVKEEKLSKGASVQAAFVIDAETKQKAFEYAASQGMTFSEFVRKLVTENI